MGKWEQSQEDMEQGSIHCTVCGTVFDYYLVNQLAKESCDAEFPQFCPKCGAKMVI